MADVGELYQHFAGRLEESRDLSGKINTTTAGIVEFGKQHSLMVNPRMPHDPAVAGKYDGIPLTVSRVNYGSGDAGALEALALTHMVPPETNPMAQVLVSAEGHLLSVYDFSADGRRQAITLSYAFDEGADKLPYRVSASEVDRDFQLLASVFSDQARPIPLLSITYSVLPRLTVDMMDAYRALASTRLEGEAFRGSMTVN